MCDAAYGCLLLASLDAKKANSSSSQPFPSISLRVTLRLVLRDADQDEETFCKQLSVALILLKFQFASLHSSNALPLMHLKGMHSRSLLLLHTIISQHFSLKKLKLLYLCLKNMSPIAHLSILKAKICKSRHFTPDVLLLMALSHSVIYLVSDKGHRNQPHPIIFSVYIRR